MTPNRPRHHKRLRLNNETPGELVWYAGHDRSQSQGSLAFRSGKEPQMRSKAALVLSLLFVGGCEADAWAQKPVAQKSVTVTVVDAHVAPALPVAALTVSLTYLDGSTRITDARDPTNPRGQAFLQVSADAAQRDDLRIVIGGDSTLVIFEPADGQLHGLGTNVPVKLLPRGSPALLGPPQIEAILRRSLLRSNELQRQNIALRERLADSPTQKMDLTGALAEWAHTNGFAASEVDRQVKDWADNIQKRSEQSTLEQKGLAEVALKHYGSAAQLFKSKGDADDEALDANEKKFKQERVCKLCELITDRQQAASAFQLNLQYPQATQVLESLTERLAKEHRNLPENTSVYQMWLRARLLLANARLSEGQNSTATDSARLISQCLLDYQSVADEYQRSGEQQNWAIAQSNLANALLDASDRANGEEASLLLNRAVQASKMISEVFSKRDDPKDWARAQVTFCLTELGASEAATGDKVATGLADAEHSCRAAFEGYDKLDSPHEWTAAQLSLADVLAAEGERAGGDRSSEFFNNAIEATHAALDIYTKDTDPENWAKTNATLGFLLVDEGQRADGEIAISLLEQADQAYKNALEVYTKTNLPQAWARTQMSLGIALASAGSFATGEQGSALLSRAVDAYKNALEIYKKTEFPQDWARTQANLGNALLWQGDLASGNEAVGLYKQGAERYEDVLEVFSRKTRPQEWARTQMNICVALREEGQIVGGEQAIILFGQAVDACHHALEVYVKTNLPQDWARTQMDLGDVYSAQGAAEDANSAYESALEVNPNSKYLLTKAAHLSHDILFQFDLALELQERMMKVEPSLGTKLNLLEANLTDAHFEACSQKASFIDTAELNPAGVLIQSSIQLACEWAAGNRKGALATEAKLLTEIANAQKHVWDFAGTVHFLSASPAFQKGRNSWIALFTSIQNGDAIGMTKALHDLEPLMQD